MDVSVIFQFLKDLAANNNREWFQGHKDEYLKAQKEFEELLTAIIARISLFDESIVGIQAKDCTYRIYRDTRFSSDKTPYKIHLGGYINARGKKSEHCGYYVHIEPDNCMLAGGSWCLESKVLKAVRQSIYDNIDEYREIVEDPAFKQYFPVIGENHLKTAPKGFPKDFEYIDYSLIIQRNNHFLLLFYISLINHFFPNKVNLDYFLNHVQQHRQVEYGILVLHQ